MIWLCLIHTSQNFCHDLEFHINCMLVNCGWVTPDGFMGFADHWCLMAPSHHLNQSWLIFTDTIRCMPEWNFNFKKEKNNWFLGLGDVNKRDAFPDIFCLFEGHYDQSHGMLIIWYPFPVHPAFTPEQCYQRIDVGFRSFLKKKHVPWVSVCCIFILQSKTVIMIPLTHWGRDKMVAVTQTTRSNAFSWMKMLEFRLRFHWSLFLWVQLTIFQRWFR